MCDHCNYCQCWLTGLPTSCSDVWCLTCNDIYLPILLRNDSGSYKDMCDHCNYSCFWLFGLPTTCNAFVYPLCQVNFSMALAKPRSAFDESHLTKIHSKQFCGLVSTTFWTVGDWGEIWQHKPTVFEIVLFVFLINSNMLSKELMCGVYLQQCKSQCSCSKLILSKNIILKLLEHATYRCDLLTFKSSSHSVKSHPERNKRTI